jgi:ABC-type branched-subunit amino acid transport system ATPase component/ABC-type branched-subunit amino acid transport system permease subunit
VTTVRQVWGTGLKMAGAPLVLLLVGIFSYSNDYMIYLATATAVAYILTSAFNIIYGYAGVFNLALVAIYGLGAFTAVYCVVQLEWSFWLSGLAATAVSALASVLIALPSRRLDELFLAIATLAFTLALTDLLIDWEEFTGGAIGIFAIPSPTFFGVDLIGGFPEYYWLCAVFAWAVFVISRRIDASGLGRRFVALREGPRVLAAVGGSMGSTRLVAFGISGAFAGLAGWLYAFFQLSLSLDTFSFQRLTILLLATILGGAGFLYGPVVGVIVLVAFGELSFASGQSQDLILGVGIIVLIALGSGGVAGVLARLGERWNWRRFWVPAKATGFGPAPRDIPQQQEELRPIVARDVEPSELVLSNVAVRFGGTVAVDGVSLTLRTGESVGLIGPNGAGKTTLFNAVTGDVRATGSIKLNGRELLGLTPEKVVNGGVARTFQSPHVIPDLTLIENLMLAGDTGSVGWWRQALLTPGARKHDRVVRERAMRMLAEFELAGRANEKAGSQTYGTLRLMEIARNLMVNPSLLLLDEPGAGLTEHERDEVASVVRRLSGSGLGVLLVDHNLSLIRAACDRVYVVDHGQVLATGTPDEVFAHEGVISAYLGVPR